MSTTTEQVAAAMLAAALLAFPSPSPAQDSAPAPAAGSEPSRPPGDGGESKARPPAGTKPLTAGPPAAGPIAASIDRHAAEVVRAHADPCAKAGTAGQPCFPVSVEEQGEALSVRDGLRGFQPDLRPAPGVPTTAEIQQQMSGAPPSASGGVSTDPVCAAKSLIRELSGQANTFFLYRLTKDGLERPLLTDRRLDLLTYTAVPGAQLEFMGEYGGECAAIAAWRKALRGARGGDEEPEPRQERAKGP